MQLSARWQVVLGRVKIINKTSTATEMPVVFTDLAVRAGIHLPKYRGK